VLKYHQFRAKLGMGDLHPGGPASSAKMLDWLSERGVQRVLEVGAGIGRTAERMVALGWDVTALEPDAVLFEELRRRPGMVARRESFLDHRPTVPYDAIVAESVLFQMSLTDAFAHACALLRPGGYLAFVEAVWTRDVTAARSRQAHEDTLRLFGIAVGSREPMTWQDWRNHLHSCGFETLRAELLPQGSAGHPPSGNRADSLRAMARNPLLLLSAVRYRLRKRRARMPSGAQESWLFLGRAVAIESLASQAPPRLDPV